MQRTRKAPDLRVVAGKIATFTEASNSIMKYLPIDRQLFIENRKKYLSHLGERSIAFFNANDEMPRSGDTSFPFRQQSDLFWLTGIDQEQTILVLSPQHPLPEYREILFLRKTNEHIAVWEGHKYTKEEALGWKLSDEEVKALNAVSKWEE